jgi:hypothetical protein
MNVVGTRAKDDCAKWNCQLAVVVEMDGSVRGQLPLQETIVEDFRVT